MMSWIRMAIASAAFLGVASVAGAQGGPPAGGPPQGEQGRGGPGMMQRMLFNGIDLTDAQKDQIQKINEKYRAQREALRPAGAQPGDRPAGPPDEATRAKMDKIRTDSQAELRGVLTPDQQKIFDKNIADMKARMEEMRKNRPQG